MALLTVFLPPEEPFGKHQEPMVIDYIAITGETDVYPVSLEKYRKFVYLTSKYFFLNKITFKII